MIEKIKSNGFEDLEVWQIAKSLAVEIYKITESFPSKEQFGLTSQIRRCSISIASNLAEGSARGSDLDFARFIAISLGSCAELKTQLIISQEVGYLSVEKLEELTGTLNQIGRMLKGLQVTVRKRAAND